MTGDRSIARPAVRAEAQTIHAGASLISPEEDFNTPGKIDNVW